MQRPNVAVWLMVIAFISASAILAQQPSATPTPNSQAASGAALDPNDPIARIRDEGLKHSQVMETFVYNTAMRDEKLPRRKNF
jgi:hypothetical protein